MFEFIQAQDFAAAFDYYKSILENNSQSILEIFLIKHYMKKPDKDEMIEDNLSKLKELLVLMTKIFDWNFVQNLMFWGQIMNKNYKEAEKIFRDDLSGELDFEVLKRIHGQSVDSMPLEIALKSLYNIYNSFLFRFPNNEYLKNDQLRNEIKSILPIRKNVTEK